MLNSYFKAAIRSLFHHRFYTFINVFGLSIGLAAVMLITLYVNQELSFDQFHENKDRIYRASLEMKEEGESFKTAVSSSAILPTLQREFPEVESGVRLYDASGVVKYADKIFRERNFLFADSTFFQVFNFPLLKGDPKNVLENPQHIVLSEMAAERYFGSEDPIGKTLLVNKNEYKVTGVMENFPNNSHFKADFIAPFSNITRTESWWPANYHTYLLLNSKEAGETLPEKITELTNRTFPEQNQGEDYVTYSLISLNDIHLKSTYEGEIQPGGNLTYLYIFSIVAFLILFVATINYMNLATARSAERAKEVGLRKVMGAHRNQLFIQFIGEAILITLLALVLALVFTQLVLPLLNEVTNSEMSINTLINPLAITILLGLVLVVGLISGSYPAIILSGFQPIKVLKGKFSRSGQASFIRKVLVVFQFTTSTVLIAATLVVFDQLQFIQNKNLGYDQGQLISMRLSREAVKAYSSFKTEMKQINGVEEMTLCTETLTSINGGYSIWVQGKEEDFSLPITANPVDDDFIKTTGVRLVSGTDFTKAQLQQATIPDREKRFTAMMINEMACKKLGFSPEEIVGKRASVYGRVGAIQAVMKDFHYASFNKKIEPLAVFLEQDYTRTVMMRISTDNIGNTLAGLQNTWKRLSPEAPFNYQFLSDEFSAMYNSEQNTAKIFSVFSSVAIIIACLGLLGLVSFMAMQRSKEIGIRKGMGASVFNIISIITSDFAKLLAIAFVIALPIVFLGMNEWLNGFAYRTNISLQVLGITVMVSALIAFSTIAYQAIKSAIANPIKSLKED